MIFEGEVATGLTLASRRHLWRNDRRTKNKSCRSPWIRNYPSYAKQTARFGAPSDRLLYRLHRAKKRGSHESAAPYLIPPSG